MARGRNTPHRLGNVEDEDEAQDVIPNISMDYFFFSKKAELASEHPMLVMLDEETGDKYARAVGKKGLGPGG